MAVRRLHSEQPASFALNPQNLAWAKETIAKFPEGRQASAVIPVLWRVQEQEGWVSEPALRAVADLLGMAYIRVYEIATFYTMFQLAPVGRKAHVQVCGTTPCMLRGSGELIDICKRRIAPHAHELSDNRDFSWEEVECLGSCANAPMIQIGADTYEDLTAARFEEIVDAFAAGRPVKPGSQTGRVASCPATGPTTLLADKDAYLAKVKQAAVPETPRVEFGRSRIAQPDWEQLARTAGDGRVGTGFVTSHVVVGDEAVGEMWRPEVLASPRGGVADDLKTIAGVGPVLEQLLNKLGIWHFWQIAGWTAENVKWIDQQLEDFRGRAERDRWVEQARKLSSGRR